MKLSKIASGLTFFLLSLSLFAQSPVERRANRLAENFAYIEAIDLYEHLLSKDSENLSVVRSLATCYQKTAQTQKAEPLLQKLVKSKDAKPEDCLQLALVLETLGRNDEALVWFNKYDELRSNDSRGKRYANAITKYKSFYNEASNYKLQNEAFNTTGSDFSVSPFNSGLLFVSNGVKKGKPLSWHPWNNQQWLDIYTVNTSGTPQAHLLSKVINTRYHEGPACFSVARNQLAFTRNSVNRGKVSRSSDNIHKLSIFFAKPGDSDFKDVEAFAFNNKEYSCAHPVFSTKGDKLYFASDMPGGYGGSDLYMCRWVNNAWSEPQNLGPNINTEGNELFPSIYKDSLLTFASTGFGGMGGLDVYSVEILTQGFGLPENPGSPLNSSYDDFSWMLLSGAKSGYISSDRPGGKGSDDVYSYTYKPSAIKILVSDAKTGKPIQGATVTVFRDSVQLDKSVMGSQGSHLLSLKSCKSYRFLVDAKNFYSQEALAEIDCPIRENSELVFRLKRPTLKVIAFNKYLLSIISGASVYVKDQTDTTLEQGLGLTNDQGEAEFDLIPGHAYEVTLDKQGLPQTRATFVAPKKEADPDVELRMGTGIPPVRGVLVKFIVKEEQTGTPVNNARVRLFNPETQEIMDVMTNELGYYETIFKENTAWTVAASRIGYFSTSKSKSSFDIKKGSKKIDVELSLLQLKEGGIIALEGIFYDLNKSDVRPDAAKVLDYVIEVMIENPSMRIELGSHTDAQGSDAYNLTLSEARAASAAAYIISKGITEDRIVGKGYGETRLKNKCGNNVKCSDQEHQENRRTEIRILDFD